MTKYASMQVYTYMQINAKLSICPQLWHFSNFWLWFWLFWPGFYLWKLGLLLGIIFGHDPNRGNVCIDPNKKFPHAPTFGIYHKLDLQVFLFLLIFLNHPSWSKCFPSSPKSDAKKFARFAFYAFCEEMADSCLRGKFFSSQWIL